jgi:hypothetical protein
MTSNEKTHPISRTWDGSSGIVEGGGGGLAEGVGSDPGELVRFGRLGGFLELGEEVRADRA